MGMEMIHVYASDGQRRKLLGELKKEVDINSRDSQGYTPLAYAALAGRPNVVKTLLNKGASVYIENNCKHTPLHAAVSGLSGVGITDEAKVANYLQVIHSLLRHEKRLRSDDADHYRNIPLLKDAKTERGDIPLALCRALCRPVATMQHVDSFKAVVEHYYPKPSVSEDLGQLVSLLWKNATSFFPRLQSSAGQPEETESLLESASPKPKSN